MRTNHHKSWLILIGVLIVGVITSLWNREGSVPGGNRTASDGQSNAVFQGIFRNGAFKSAPEFETWTLRVAGRVVDRDTGVGVPNVDVVVRAFDLGEKETHCSTDGQGNFISNEMTAWGASFEARKDGYVMSEHGQKNVRFSDPASENFFDPKSGSSILLYMRSLRTVMEHRDANRSEWKLEKTYSAGEQVAEISISDGRVAVGNEFRITLTPVTGKEESRGLRIRIVCDRGGVWWRDRLYSERPIGGDYKGQVDVTPAQGTGKLHSSATRYFFLESQDKRMHALLEVDWNSGEPRNAIRLNCKMIP